MTSFNFGCFRINLQEIISIPPRNKMIYSEKLLMLNNVYVEYQSSFVIEPNKTFFRNLGHCRSSYISKSKDYFGRTFVIKHNINTEQVKLTKKLSRGLPNHAAEIVDQEVENMIERGIVEPSLSPWAAGMVLVEKRDGTKGFL